MIDLKEISYLEVTNAYITFQRGGSDFCDHFLAMVYRSVFQLDHILVPDFLERKEQDD